MSWPGQQVNHSKPTLSGVCHDLCYWKKYFKALKKIPFLSPDTIPPPPTPTFPAPALSVQPSTGVVKHGDMLSFQCSVPLLPSQPLHQSSYYNKPLTFLLLRTGEGTGVASTIQMPPAGLVSSPQPGVFSVVPVRGRDEGEYACLYQITNKQRLVNSTVSNTVHITITGENVHIHLWV